MRGMNGASAPGPDGFGPSFYKAAWPTVKCQVMAFLEAFHTGDVDLERINRSYMVLLPKKPGADSVDAFRPICLQNCSIKITAKILTNRLQQDIHRLIDLDQTGFLRGRSISENFVYALELVQVCHKRKLPTLVLKLDFAKTFDTVNWDALLAIMEARGLNDKWRAWVEQLLSTSRFAVLVNGCPGPWISCRRGLVQGDPMSPYLFLLVADVLQRLIKDDAGVRHPATDETCTVLQYADDTLIVCRGTHADAAKLKLLLDQFSAATGLKINYNKSTIVPLNVDEVDLQPCLEVMGCKREGFPQTYLGLPLSADKLRLSAFTPYIAKADRHLAGWQAMLLNPMGRATLINSVLDSQLIYLMCAVPMPAGTISAVAADVEDSYGLGKTWPNARAASSPGTESAWPRIKVGLVCATWSSKTSVCCSSCYIAYITPPRRPGRPGLGGKCALPHLTATSTDRTGLRCGTFCRSTKQSQP